MTHQRLQPPPREVELKLAVPEGSLKTLAKHLTSHPSVTQDATRRRQVTTYFDTTDHALLRAGMSLRVRIAGGRHVQTLKADQQDGVAANRGEWEWPIERDEPDLGLLAQTPAATALPEGLAVAAVFSTQIERTMFVLTLADGSVVEAAIDEGVIRTEAAVETVCELELELRSGPAVALYQFGLELHAATPVVIESESKSARGYRLLSGLAPVARKAGRVAFGRTASAGSAFQQILNSGLGHLLANQPATRSGDAEGVHQMRVAIRRLRAALTLFQPLLEPHANAVFQKELRRIGQVFGQARDWDVFCLQILPGALETGWQTLLLQPAMELRETAHRRMTEELAGPAFTALVLGLAVWTEDKTLLDGKALRRPLQQIGPDLLDRVARKVARRGRKIGHQSDGERHALRKSLKKLRYGIDFLHPVFRHRKADFYLHACKKLQQCLGDLNDAVTATRLAEHLADAGRPGLAPAVGALASALDRRKHDAVGELDKRWKAFRDQPHFWD